MLVDVVGEFAEEVVRPAAADANEACAAPDDLLKASLEIGLPILGRARGARRHRRPSAPPWPAPWSHEALAQGRHGPGRRRCSPPAPSPPRSSLWGSDEQQSTYLPAFTGDEVPAAALALAEPTPLFDPTQPGHHGRRARATASCSTA